jgi:IS30 family transposase
MGTTYLQLTLEDRCTIARLHEGGQSCRQIAAALDRAPSTIARELKRNKGRQVGYRPAYADEQAWARRWRGSRLVRQPDLRALVLERLAMGHSPEQVAGRLALEEGRKVISHESIYRFIYAQIRRTEDTSWRFYLPRYKYKRGYRRRHRSPPDLIPGRVPISRRPPDIDRRQSCGHWEADLMLFAQTDQVILVSHERTSRLTLTTSLTSKEARPIIQHLTADLASLPAELRQSMTFDNGAEFTYHRQLNQIGTDTYFCKPHSPWQKGGIENAIGRLRYSLPRKAAKTATNQENLDTITAKLNNIPRKCLDFLTPAEIFKANLLHFKCESTPRLWPG